MLPAKSLLVERLFEVFCEISEAEIDLRRGSFTGTYFAAVANLDRLHQEHRSIKELLTTPHTVCLPAALLA